MKPKKDRVIKDVKAEYLKRMKSPAYVKQVKRNIQMFENYNLYFCDDKIPRHELRRIAHYFAEDVKNPITKPGQIIQEKPDVLTDSLPVT
jgi:hypothetical protein